MNAFEAKLSVHGLALRRAGLQTLQINVGRKCNQACRHCHVEICVGLTAGWRARKVSSESNHESYRHS